MTQEYLTHDNGSRPFKVVIADGNVKIYTRIPNSIEEFNSEPYLTYDPLQIFIGKSPLNEMTDFSGGWGPEFDGNSILLKTNDLKYIFIGHKIFSFKPQGEIIKFVSPVGNNDVPYPYAIDTNDNFYLLIENVIVKNIPENAQADPHYYYYDRTLITENIGTIPPKQPIVKNFRQIREFFISGDQYTLRYNPHPSANYDRLIHDLGSELTLTKTNGQTQVLNKTSYARLMRDFGK